ncbi:MAG TPA: PIN domain-containing protein [Candidatus Limnocylindrales bacterium]|nr:PIN domain-containing protein [Candidatus Limnocylindrales bacterium]
MSVFVDTSMFYAAIDAGDIDHERAKRTLSGESGDLLTTDHVLFETWRLLRKRLGRPVAERFFETIRAGLAEFEYIEPRDVEAAWAIGLGYPDQDFSIVDRTSFAVMERLGVRRVATFDSDFAIYRFGPRRDRAFEIVA